MDVEVIPPMFDIVSPKAQGLRGRFVYRNAVFLSILLFAPDVSLARSKRIYFLKI